MKTNKLKRNNTNAVFNWHLIPLLMTLVLVPLIVHSKVIYPVDPYYKIWLNSKPVIDFFSYYKGGLVLIFAGISLCSIIGVLNSEIKLLGKKPSGIKISRSISELLPYICLSVYLLGVLFSTAFSKWGSISFWGLYDRHEGFLVLSAYCVLFVAALLFTRSKADAGVLIKGLLISASIMTLVGITQFVGHDLFATDFGKRLILDSNLYQMGLKTNITLEQTMIYGTLYHANYMGSYAIICFFIFASHLLLKRENRIEMGVLSLASLFLLIGSRSRAGLLGLFIAIVLSAFVFRKAIFRSAKIIAISAFTIILIAFGMNYMTHGSILNKITSITFDPRMNQSTVEVLKDINIGKQGELTIKTSLNQITVKPKGQYQISISDNKGHLLNTQTNQNTGNITIQEKGYGSFVFQVGQFKNEKLLKVSILENIVFFDLSANGFKMLDPYGHPTNIRKIETWGFEGKERWGSARAYIWSRSIPMLKNTILIGNGPDTFVFAFPQDDYVGKMIAYGTNAMIVDKPHNIYLQIALNTGIVSLMAFIVLIGSYIWSSWKLYFRGIFNSEESKYGVGFFLATFAYLIAGFFNDSVLSVAPIFWIIFGAGYGLNLAQLKKLADNRQ